MIKAVAVDLGGVLFAEGKSVAAATLANTQGYDKNTVIAIFTSAKSFDLRRGLLSDEQFWSWARDQLPEDYDTKLIRQAWHDGYLIDGDILDLLRVLKPRYTLIAFSSNIKSRIEYLDAKYGFRRYFDKEVYSFDYQLDKPQQAFAERLLEQAECRPQEIVYIDDQASALVPAKKLGINTVVYSRGEIAALRKSLSGYSISLADPLSDPSLC